MTTIDHAAEARDLLDRASSVHIVSGVERVAHSIATAQAHATLAVARTAETANLIARWDALRNPPISVRPSPDDWAELERLDREIRARLGVEDVTP